MPFEQFKYKVKEVKKYFLKKKKLQQKQKKLKTEHQSRQSKANG